MQYLLSKAEYEALTNQHESTPLEPQNDCLNLLKPFLDPIAISVNTDLAHNPFGDRIVTFKVKYDDLDIRIINQLQQKGILQ